MNKTARDGRQVTTNGADAHAPRPSMTETET